MAVVGETLRFEVDVRDNNEDALTFEGIDLPADATLTPTGVYGKAIFEWTPDLSDLGNYAIAIKVSDSGNGDAAEALSSQEPFNIVVRDRNTAPILAPIGNLTVTEQDILDFTPNSFDEDGDPLTYSVENLPPGATFSSSTGRILWTPSLLQQGIYNDMVITVSDGHSSSSETISITVGNLNQAPVLVPLPPQLGREGSLLEFTLAAGDIDGDAVLFSMDSPLPVGANFEPATGHFSWTPDFGSAGAHIFQFTATDSQGLTHTQEVFVSIDNTNRAPELEVSGRSIALGETLTFTLEGSDLDSDDTLTYASLNLPEGATLDKNTGAFTWTPSPGQAGDYVLRFEVSDGELVAEKSIELRVAITPEVPDVGLVLTPSFPPTPGQSVSIAANAEGLADIASIEVRVNGEVVAVDENNRATFTPDAAGRFVVEAIATDLDGRVGRTETDLLVRDPADNAAPIVSFAVGLDGRVIDSLTDVLGSVTDQNLDEWVLELAEFGSGDFREIANGYGPTPNNALAQLDPAALENGFYQLRLRATDVGDRISVAEITVEVNSEQKDARYYREETDLSVQLGSTQFDFVRAYDSFTTDEVGTFGNGWRLANADFNLQTNVPLTGREELGIYSPLESGSRLYLTVPNGDRIGFTFTPQKISQLGVTYYKPVWTADDGVTYELSSNEVNLTRVGDRFFDLETARPYNPANAGFDGFAYSLTAADGTTYHLDAQGTVQEQITPAGDRFFFSSSGITSASGEVISFIRG